ncbi:hypothetical protein M5K25_024826 [Dendrobium thyrsiflorum]|uniref:Uncharacterized protein n=1 Tax=Dendrobium thyrsiflorum TaxID=117978 RepID=A0ABD0U370_DENTH
MGSGAANAKSPFKIKRPWPSIPGTTEPWDLDQKPAHPAGWLDSTFLALAGAKRWEELLRAGELDVKEFEEGDAVKLSWPKPHSSMLGFESGCLLLFGRPLIVLTDFECLVLETSCAFGSSVKACHGFEFGSEEELLARIPCWRSNTVPSIFSLDWKGIGVLTLVHKLQKTDIRIKPSLCTSGFILTGDAISARSDGWEVRYRERNVEKVLEAQPKTTISEAKAAIDGQESGGNPYPRRRGENQEVEILEGKDGMPPLELIFKEEMSSRYERMGADFARPCADFERRGLFDSRLEVKPFNKSSVAKLYHPLRPELTEIDQKVRSMHNRASVTDPAEIHKTKAKSIKRRHRCQLQLKSELEEKLRTWKTRKPQKRSRSKVLTIDPTITTAD